ncbi:rho GTPase-activating protein 7-like isoform X1 [Tachypleus tridentatus]|uniref:rho GTPase-activating protein 7-like isoform X1 n=1 Tax=Tachypleus tridentatus TaxID=6853 RepID=UPI003FD3EFB2
MSVGHQDGIDVRYSTQDEDREATNNVEQRTLTETAKITSREEHTFKAVQNVNDVTISNLSEKSRDLKTWEPIEDNRSSAKIQTLLTPVQQTEDSSETSGRTATSVKRKACKENDEFATPPSPRTKQFLRENNFKSCSAPLLQLRTNYLEPRKSPSAPASPDDVRCLQDTTLEENTVFNSPRSQSVKELSELEAMEACNWLRAAGFPQYSQIYEDGHFSINISSVQEDHKFLDPDSIQALIRRLNILNKCAKMKVENLPRKSIQPPEESDEEQCALSENWQFQRTSRRWSRIPSPLEVSIAVNKHLKHSSPTEQFFPDNDLFTSSHDSVFVDDHQSSPDSPRAAYLSNFEEHITSDFLCVPLDEDHFTSGSGGSTSCGSEKSSDFSENSLESLRRSGSERFKDSAKALLRRIESLKGKRKKKSREGLVIGEQLISNEVANDSSQGSEPNGSSPSSLAPSPQLPYHKSPQDSASDQGSLQGEGSEESQHITSQVQCRKRRQRLQETDLHVASTSESSTPKLWHHDKDANSNVAKDINEKHPARQNNQDENIFLTEDNNEKLEKNRSNIDNKNISKEDSDCNSFTKLAQQLPSEVSELKGREEQAMRITNISPPTIIFSRTTSVEQSNNKLREDLDTEALSSQDEAERSTLSTRERRDSGVGSSLTRSSLCNSASQTRWHWFPSIRRQSSINIQTVTSHGIQISSLSASQLMKLRKLALLKMTSLMEKYNPTSRTGWNWGVPKFIKKIRTPDYKDKVVFGVPLLLILQKTGHPLPPSIQAAMRYLQKTAVSSVGLFRKSGVRSRIQKLRNLNESNPENISYEEQQPYDVADMLKQYFRELPDALLTNKLSETFISIFQYIPTENQKEAVQAAILLMPDENREVLQSLLTFLQEVSLCCDENQMTATNLAVCFAPSLFHLTIPRSASASPRRRKTVGVPDQREINENRAAHECLSFMITNCKQLFSVTEETLRRANADQWEPPTLEELGSLTNSKNYNWKTHIEMYLQGLQKEARDKFKGWIVLPQHDSVEVSYKKVDDGHPLRLWKLSVEVEAPPVELLNRLMRDRNVWDDTLAKWRIVSRLDNQSEIFQYVCNSFTPHPPRDYCVLRSWVTDVPKGPCTLVEMSVDHPDAPCLQGSVRGIVLASHFLIEPCGAGKSRVTRISRVDTRGRSPEWYNKSFGHICALQLARLRDSFKHGTEGPETKV